MRKRTMLAVGLAVGVAAAMIPTLAAQAAPSKRTLSGTTPGWAKASALQSAAPGSDQVGFRVYLGWRNASALSQLATAVSTPGNASYGKFLTSQQFRSQYSPAQSDVTAVQKWLRDSGFTVD